MFTQEYKLTPETEGVMMTPFLAKVLNAMADTAPGFLMQWQLADPERFRLVITSANFARQLQPAVSRTDADYWIKVIKARGLDEGEDCGRVKVN